MDFSWQLIKTAFYLVIIIILFFVLIKFINRQSRLPGFNRNLRIIEKLHFNSDQGLYLVEVMDEVWVIGVSNDNIELLSRIEDSERIEELIQQDSERKNFNLKTEVKKYFNKDE
ncbi:flagellar biosynthetic protein FliO [Selenihalanaerobacter shriftii]|uniref:Flagellar protein FliO/FliZ n=1 Tax=Selenihalanaerobacter shriftii TaxID=142842 RepID=A0A1T4MC02_9FIRM|nr:flagellar biosynthetic protein FliO [Selenihalanaerobacter shriftii]SJZ64406.1 flagellar protein FliO/FliZ [Selenihalanaerobacter shriftii]